MYRVRVLKHALPLDVGFRIAGRVAWLRQELLRLDPKLKLKYPPLEIVPAFLYQEFPDGSVMQMHGRVGLRPYLDEVTYSYTVQIPAPTLVEFDYDLIRGILAHEFLHVVADTLTALAFMRAGGTVYGQRVEPGYEDSFEEYQRIDRAITADPVLWLPEDLRTLAERVESEDDTAQVLASERIRSTWLGRSLPKELNVPGPRVSVTMVLDQDIIARAATLGVIGETGEA